MSFFHLSTKPIGRSDGRSAVASAAYRSGDDLYDEREGKRYDYTDKPGMIHASILLPAGAPDEFGSRGKLWNAAEAAERRKDSRVAREIEFALPEAFSNEQNIAFARRFVQETFVERYGVAADVCLHRPRQHAPHCHAMLTTREVVGSGMGCKVTELDRKDALLQWREHLAVRMNMAMAAAGLAERVDHRSYKERGLRIDPGLKLGPVVGKMQAEGQPSDRMAAFKRVARQNGEAIRCDPTIALDALIEGKSTFDGYDIAKLASRCSDGEEQFHAVIAAVRAHPEFVIVGHDQDGNERYSTREMVALEQAMVEHADALAAAGRHGLSWGAEKRTLKDTTLGPEQKEAFKHVVGKQRLALVAGIAGTGKSRMLGTARKAWEASGYRVRGATISGIAAEALQEGSGIESRTIASLEYAWAQDKEALTKNDVLVIDEAGMVGSRQMERLLSAAKQAGSKVVLVGDAEQLQPIAAGSAFRALAERHGVAHLSAVRRQQSKWMRKATTEFATDRTGDALARYESAGMVHEAATREEAREKLVAMWAHDREERPDRTSIILTHTRAEVAELNGLAREAMRSSGALSGDDVALTTERGERAFAVGDRVLFLRNDRDLRIKNGSIGTVREVASDRMSVQLDDGTKAGAGRIVGFDPRAYAHVEHGYATTIHKAQGVTVRNAYVLATPGMDRTISYVAMTRHTRRAELVYARKDFREGFTGLVQRLGRDGRKDTTLDYRRKKSMALKKQDVHTLYGTAETRAVDEAWKIATERDRRPIGWLEMGSKQWAVEQRVVKEVEKNGFVSEKRSAGDFFGPDVRYRKGDHIITIGEYQDDPNGPPYHEYRYINLKKDGEERISAVQAVEIVRAIGAAEKEAATQETPFQQRLREVRERQAEVQKETAQEEETPFQRRLREAQQQTMRQSAAQKF